MYLKLNYNVYFRPLHFKMKCWNQDSTVATDVLYSIS